MTILVTGGAGYIGSHFVKLLQEKGVKIIVFDNLSRGHRESVPDSIAFEHVSLLDFQRLKEAIAKYSIDVVVHFAAFAYVGESVENPLMYYENNVIGSFNLLNAMRERGIDKIVFSSTCSVYGNPEKMPISEDTLTSPINPYAKSKLMVENILSDYSNAYGIRYVALRYFNAAGASEDITIGESHDPEPHLIPLVLYTALGKRDSIRVFGNDYPTPDGTCIRDYIHVSDLGDAHIRAVEYLVQGKESTVINLGTGVGNSVLEVIKSAEKVTGKKIHYEVVGRRPGDPAVLVADNTKASKVLGWQPKFNLDSILTTAWNWHRNPRY